MTPEEDGSQVWSFIDTCRAFLSPRARDFAQRIDDFLREGRELAGLADSLNEGEQLFVRIYLKNRAIKRLIDGDRRKKIDELYEARQLRKVRGSSPRLHVCHGSGCPVCGGGS